MALSRKTARKLVAQGKITAELHRVLENTPRWTRRFSTATALRRALGPGRPARQANKAFIGRQAYRRILRAALGNSARRRAIQEAIREHGRKGDGSPDAAQLFTHVFGKPPRHPVEYLVRGGLLVFLAHGSEPGVLSSGYYGMFFTKSNDEEVKAPKLRGAVAVVRARPEKGLPGAVLHEATHHFSDLNVMRPAHTEARADDDIDRLLKNQPTSRTLARVRVLAVRNVLEDVKEELIARFREGHDARRILRERSGDQVHNKRRKLLRKMSPRWRSAARGSMLKGVSETAFVREVVSALQEAVDAGVDRELVVHTALLTGYKDVPAVMRALIRAHGRR